MAGALRKTMLYLGLADDRAEHEEYLEDYDDGEVAVPTEFEAQVTPLHRATRKARAFAGWLAQARCWQRSHCGWAPVDPRSRLFHRPRHHRL